MPNRLIKEKSPYLLQHANNPVDWYPWGEDAFRKALEEDKPILLSVGYATCHWCHVMERESFEDEDVAGVLNQHFVSIKVDREERPDVDHIYMTVCQALTGRGGWPLSIIMTPTRRPFFAGTYFPKSSRMGMPGFLDILLQAAKLWSDDRQRLVQMGEEITRAIQPKGEAVGDNRLGMEILEKGYSQLRSAFDEQRGGFGGAPKFPTPHHLTFLLRWHRRNPESDALKMVEKTLNSMRDGGIFDQVGFGFHRYSVDERWLVPHFEKMLYDQAMLVMAYCEAYQITGKPLYAQVVRETLEYVLRDMRDPGGGFYSAEDADSEGEEGLFYVWRPDEVKEFLGEEQGGKFCGFFDISPTGNFEEGRSILHITKPQSVFAQLHEMSPEELENMLEGGRSRLFAARKKRIHPLKDDKVLASWNGLMIAALAKGYQALRDSSYLEAASAGADFVLERMTDGTGRLFRRYRDGEVANPGYADDYAFLIWGLIELYECSFEVRYLKAASELQRHMVDHFWSEKQHGFYYSADDSEQLIVRDREIYDGAIPSSNSVAALNLLRLGRMTGNVEWEERADALLKSFSSLVADYPSGYTQFLNAADFALGPTSEVVIVGDDEDEETRMMVESLQRRFHPHRVLLFKSTGWDGKDPSEWVPFLRELHPIGGKRAVYLCENYACRQPVSTVDELKEALGD